MTDTTTKPFLQNTWVARAKRTITCVLPVDKSRKGNCKNCGACCRLPTTCPFLHTNGQGSYVCDIYRIRPLSCRKYPRTKSEHTTADTCGYSFDGENR